MPRFRKKPVVVEAWQNVHDAIPPDWLAGTSLSTPGTKQYIHTLEGMMTANAGDWIIKGVKGELYPCKPDIFAATYEQVDAVGNGFPVEAQR